MLFRFCFYSAIFLFAVFWFALGSDSPTGLTGKDEFFLGLRTPLAMMENNAWLIPILDDLPRIRKPPLLYWCGRAFYEAFGVSLFSIRFLACLFSACFVLGAVATARFFGINKTFSVLLAFLLMSSLGMATEGSRVMLDIPVATFSLWAFWAFLQARKQRAFILLCALLLALGFLTKGPVVFVLFGAGVLALFLSAMLGKTLFFNRANYQWGLGAILLWMGIALPWFIEVRMAYPEYSAHILQNELANREFFNLNLTPFSALFVLSMPWFFIGLAALWRAIAHSTVSAHLFSKKTEVDRGKLPRFCAFWLIFSLLPFCFIRSFERYLIASLIPFFLLIVLFLKEQCAQQWARRSGFILSSLASFLLLLFVLYFYGNTHLAVIFLCALILFFFTWWQPANVFFMTFSALIFWKVTLSAIYPAIGVNAIEQSVIDFARTNPVAFFNGPQPAMLSILSGRAHRHFERFSTEDLQQLKDQKTTIFVSIIDFPLFLNEMHKHHAHFHVQNQFETLASTGSGLRFARVGTTLDDWLNALHLRSIQPLTTTIYAVQLDD